MDVRRWYKRLLRIFEKMNIYEIIATKRSGHHAIIAWLVKNLTGMNLSLHHKTDDEQLKTIKTEYINDKILHWNDANNNQDFGLKLFKGSHLFGKLDNLIVNYEDVNSNYSFFYENEKFEGPLSKDRFSDIKITKTKRIVIIRDFYNCIASRYKQKKDGLFPHNTSIEFLNYWKNNANFVLNNPNNHIKYEDWMSNRKLRNDILLRYFNTYEIYGPETINGRGSSFSDKNFNNRFTQIELPEETKDLIRKDNELHYLIGALGYEYKEI